MDAVFKHDKGFMQCRPVGHKKARRMCFIDYDSTDAATKGMQAHQGHKWENVDSGLSIDFDHDARSKRNTAMDEGNFEKFFPSGPRKEKAEDVGEQFARAQDEEAEAVLADRLSRPVLAVRQLKSKPAKAAAAARLQIRNKADGTTVLAAGAVAPAVAKAADGEGKRADGALGGLLGYASDDEDDEEEDEEEDAENCGEESDEEEEEEAEVIAAPAGKRMKV